MTSVPGSASLLVGCAAGFSGDRTDAARPVVDTLIRLGGPAVLIFETLAERTLALAQLARQRDPEGGFEPLLDEMLRPVLADCLAHRIPIVGNFGAANPPAAARRVKALAAELGLRVPVVAVVGGDALVSADQRALLARTLASEGRAIADDTIACANVYLGAEGIADALRQGADVVVTGRVADPSLTVGPALAHFDWALDDWDRLAGATMAGHLLECGAQVCGGYYADPGFKDVPDLATVGFPIARIEADGSCTVFKADRTGGCVDEHTVKEQLLYELHDPSAYLTPDVVADIGAAEVRQVGPDEVRLSGVRGHRRPESLKANVFFANGWLAEGEISYAGPGAEARARLAAEVLRARLGERDRQGPLRVDLIGVTSVLGDDTGDAFARLPAGDARDVRLRVAANHADRAGADSLTREVTALYTCGPAGGGGVRTNVRPRLGLRSCLFPRALATATVTLT
ncbi:acyclic terpene utilization AtuA family protein [Roseateles chitinivorans]|uniref:acyclic terpene utilization AtuA family protein n=1 Tax=Roseateles chitinivorans TaxID=2917965 RepID=UPI003D66F008